MSGRFLEPVLPEGFPAPSGFSHGLLAPAGARLLFVAGQIAWDGERRLVSGGFAEQFRRALENVVAVVRTAGGGPEHLARLTLFVTDRGEYLAALPAVGTAYRAVMGRHYPTMSLLEVQGLLEPGAKVEIEGTAMLPA
ncbi:MAG TPA: RidA family protein [Thermoanaerobaculia bacterium]|nr:RidA family protein [Thermoanaerobaculia bacterium]